MTTPTHTPDDPPTLHDVDKVGTLVLVYLTVLGLAVANMLLALHGELGSLALPVQLAIASVQACVVAWYWMHMRRGDKVVTLTAVTSLFFIFIFYVLSFSDLTTRYLGGI
jgi:cytochrome c oxidase subunit 4